RRWLSALTGSLKPGIGRISVVTIEPCLPGRLPSCFARQGTLHRRPLRPRWPVAGRDACVLRLVAPAAAPAPVATTSAAGAATPTPVATASTPLATASTPSFAPGSGLVDREAAAVHVLAVEGLDGRLGLLIAAHLHEAKPLGAAGVAVHDDLCR